MTCCAVVQSRNDHATSVGGFTLIELLAVLVILGIGMGAALALLSSVRGTFGTMAATDSVRTGIERARILAQRCGRCELSLSSSGVMARSSESDVVVGARVPPEWSMMAVDVNGGVLADPIAIDRSGRSIDFVVVLSGSKGERARVAVLGLSGQTVVEPTQSEGKRSEAW